MVFLQAPPRGIVFDLGDVLFTWSANTTTSVPARKLRDILLTPIWYSYERGEITRDVCYELSARQFSLPVSDITEAFAQARKSLQPDHDIVSFLQELRKDSSILVYAMSNMGNEDFQEITAKTDWSIFDRVFTSGAAQVRKPELGFYRYVLECINLSGNQVVFIDDKEENVNGARAVGIWGLVFGKSTANMLDEMLNSPIGRGWRYLFRNAKQCGSVTDSGVVFADNFAKLLVADTLQDRSLVDLSWGSKKTWNFFSGKPVLIPEGIFPDDLDTTALALKVLQPSASEATSILDMMAEYVRDDGSFQTYFDRSKDRVDPVVSANILACFYYYNRGHEFQRTLNYVRLMLLNRSYIQGTRYYSSPDCCLGFIGRLLRSSNDNHLQTTLGPLLEAQVRERVGLGGSALDLAMRIITCSQLGVQCEHDRRALLDLQCDDGCWEGGWLYQYGRSKVKIGNRAVTTAMAIAALSS
ncbi:HAD-like protein [Daldinia bambusicola]|nr:HAD-like protein [Daldinia bambusicola]